MTVTRPTLGQSNLLRARGALGSVVGSIAAIAVALVIGALIIILSGEDAILAYRALFEGAFVGRRAITETLVATTPLIFGGLAFAIAARAGLFNIGIEGQFFLGSLAAGLVGAIDLGLPTVIHLPLAILAGVTCGGIWGMLPGALKARTGASEVITTIMLNYVAFQIGNWSLRQDDFLAINPDFQATDPVEPTARLAILVEPTRLHAGLLLALLAALILWYLLFRTTFGYRIRTVGLSRGAASYAGISWGGTIVVAMLASGVLGGLGGASETLGLQGRHYSQPAGYGFTAIAVGLVGRNHPVGVVLAAFLFGALNAGATQMQARAGTSREIVMIIQGLVILSVAAFAALGQFSIWPRRNVDKSDRSSEVGMDPEIEARPGPPSV